MKYTKSIFFASGLTFGIGGSLIVSFLYRQEVEKTHDALIHGSPGEIEL